MVNGYWFKWFPKSSSIEQPLGKKNKGMLDLTISSDAYLSYSIRLTFFREIKAMTPKF